MKIIKDYLDVVFQEVPGEISLAISICGCGKRCKGCHTPELQTTIMGDEFRLGDLKKIMEVYKDYLTCVLFFEGDVNYTTELKDMLCYIKSEGLKTCLYTGRNNVPEDVRGLLDYLKVGEYREECGGLNSTKTNQRLYDLREEKDITYKFWRLEDVC